MQFLFLCLGVLISSLGLQIKGVISQDDGYGIEFFIGINKNSVGPSKSLILYITTASVDPVKFHVESIDSILHSGRVMLDKAEAVYLDSYYMVNTSSYGDHNKGIRVYTENGGLISVLQVNYRIGSVSETIVYPFLELCQSQYVYYTMSTPAGAIVSDTSLTLLVGTTDNTTVTIKPTQNVVLPEIVKIPIACTSN